MKEVERIKARIREFVQKHKDHMIRFRGADSFLGHRLECECGEVMNIYPPREIEEAIEDVLDPAYEEYCCNLADFVAKLEEELGIEIAPY